MGIRRRTVCRRRVLMSLRRVLMRLRVILVVVLRRCVMSLCGSLVVLRCLLVCFLRHLCFLSGYRRVRCRDSAPGSFRRSPQQRNPDTTPAVETLSSRTRVNLNIRIDPDSPMQRRKGCLVA